MRQYNDLTDEELLAEIAEYQAARKEHILGKSVERVAGEGRLIKYFGLDKRSVDAELRELYVEAENRGLPIGDNNTGRAIPVEIG